MLISLQFFSSLFYYGNSDTYPEPCQKSSMEFFSKIINCWKMWTIVVRSSISDDWLVLNMLLKVAVVTIILMMIMVMKAVQSVLMSRLPNRNVTIWGLGYRKALTSFPLRSRWLWFHGDCGSSKRLKSINFYQKGNFPIFFLAKILAKMF